MTAIDYTCISKTFEALTTDELYAILKLRQEVFVVEQDCPYLDADGKDLDAIHVFAQQSDKSIIGYTRVLGPGVSYPTYASIGRVVNDPSIRGKGLGKLIMKVSIEACRAAFPQHDIKISAQTYLDGFYQSLGFVSTGEYYLEDDMPHQGMILKHT